VEWGMDWIDAAPG